LLSFDERVWLDLLRGGRCIFLQTVGATYAGFGPHVLAVNVDVVGGKGFADTGCGLVSGSVLFRVNLLDFIELLVV